jgi:hypothetical protein
MLYQRPAKQAGDFPAREIDAFKEADHHPHVGQHR